MAGRFSVIDADGHVLEREQEVRKHLQAPFNKRATPLVPRDQPWDNDLTMTRPADYPAYTPAPGVVIPIRLCGKSRMVRKPAA